jgi:hypothetical protein
MLKSLLRNLKLLRRQEESWLELLRRLLEMRSSGRSFDVLLEALEVKMVSVELRIEMHHKNSFASLLQHGDI